MPQNCIHSLVLLTENCDVGMKWQALKYKQDCSFLSPAKFRKIFSKINDIIKSSLLKWIICHTHLIQSPISNDHSIVNFDDLIGGVNTELH